MKVCDDFLTYLEEIGEKIANFFDFFTEGWKTFQEYFWKFAQIVEIAAMCVVPIVLFWLFVIYCWPTLKPIFIRVMSSISSKLPDCSLKLPSCCSKCSCFKCDKKVFRNFKLPQLKRKPKQDQSFEIELNS